MSMVDIKRGFRQYSEKEILAYAQSGVLVCGDYELDGFITYVMTGIDEIIDERVQAERDKWENEFERGDDWDEEFK